MSLLLIAFTAAILLAVTFTFSINAAQDLASAHTRVIASKAKVEIETFVDRPVMFLDEWQYSLRRGNVSLPKDSPKYDAMEWSEPWIERVVGPMAAGDFSFQYTILVLADGNAAICLPQTADTFRCQVYHWGDRDASNASQMSTVINTDYFKGNYTVADSTTSPTVYDGRTRSWYTLGATAPGVKAWGVPLLSAIPTLLCITISAGIYNGSGTFLGVGSIFLNLDAMRELLGTTLAVPNVVSFLIDNSDLLLASTHNLPLSTTTTIPAGSVVSLPSNCLRSDSANGATLSIMVCREGIKSYGYAPLQELTTDYPTYVAHGEAGTMRVIKLAGAHYYVAVVPIETKKAEGMGWRYAMFMPEDEVTGGIVRGRDIAIYICVAVVALAAIVSVVVVTLLLRPLDAIADRMYRTAMMQDLEGEETTSSLSEIATIQTAFNMMSAELSKIKSFLPQSVLEQLYGGTDDDEGDAATVTDNRTGKSGSAVHDTVQPTPTNSSSGGAPTLNTAVRMSGRKVTILSLNVLGFQRLASSRSADDLLARHGRIVKAVSDACSDHRGVMDGFQGDRFLVSFNAVTNAASHTTLAAHTAAAASAAIWSDQSVMVTSGIATGSALVGNMGSATTKRFTVVSPAVNFSVLLERLGKKYCREEGPITMTGGAAAIDLDTNFDLLTLDVMLHPTLQGGNHQRVRVCGVMGVKEAAADEWMYELHEGSSKSLYRACNDAFGLFLEGMIDDAALSAEYLSGAHANSELSAASGHSWLVKETLHYIGDLVRRAQGTKNPTEFGCCFSNPIPEYLTKCLLPHS